MSDKSDGLLELPQDAPVGADIRDYLKLDDEVIELAIAANRGECMSMIWRGKPLCCWMCR